MKRPRPYIPLSVRLSVAERMAGFKPYHEADSASRLAGILLMLFAGAKAHLDHDPPLRVRAFNPRTGKYKPDANDPRYLVWRTAEDHRVKTLVRGERGQYSDLILINRERKREKKKAGLWPSYRWPKRKMRSRKCFHPRKPLS